MQAPFLTEYRPFKQFSSMIPAILRAITEGTEPGVLNSYAESLMNEFRFIDFVINEKMKDRYYEYQELSLAIESFLLFHSAILHGMHQQFLNDVKAKTKTHAHNFLNTQKVE